MSRNLSDAQAAHRNAADFTRQLTILHQAAVGVILCRSREPFRAIETMRNFAFSERMGFKVWTISRGWATHERNNPEADPQCDNVIDPLGALKKITANDSEESCVYVMMYPHKPLAQNIAMLQIVKEYSREFSEMRKRLVLITPFGWELPAELQDDVVILDFDVPSYPELGESYAKTVESVRENKRPRFSVEEIDRILSAGAGMTAHEFENAVSRALVTKRDELPVSASRSSRRSS